MTDLRTTIAGFVAGAVTMLQAFGVAIPTEVSSGIVAISLFTIGFFSKDK